MNSHISICFIVPFIIVFIDLQKIGDLHELSSVSFGDHMYKSVLDITIVKLRTYI